MMKLAIFVLSVMLLALQTKVWFSNVGRFAAADLQREVLQQDARARRVAAANEQLVAQVVALRSGTEAIEASARADLGMIKQGEEYYVVAMREAASHSMRNLKPATGQTPASTLGYGAQLP